MTEQHHRIRRQIFEIGVREAADAWTLQQALGRLQALHIEALVDRCCTEAGDPNRLHRIESLEIDLGRLDLADLERDLLAKLGPSLRRALGEQIAAGDERAARAGEDPEAASRLELLALFARTGNLPWWAPASGPRAVNDAVRLLLERAAPSLVGLVRALSRQRAPLRRIALACDDERLGTLLRALLVASRPDVGESPSELCALLPVAPFLVGLTPSRFRAAVWAGALRAAATKAQGAAGREGFWREALTLIALEAGITYKALVFGLGEGIRAETSGRSGLLAETLRCLARELRGSASETLSASPGGAPPEAGTLDRARAFPPPPPDARTHEPVSLPESVEWQGAPFERAAHDELVAGTDRSLDRSVVPEAGSRDESVRSEPAGVSAPELWASEGAPPPSGARGPGPQAGPATPPVSQARQAAWQTQESTAAPARYEQIAAELGLLLARLAQQGAAVRGLLEELAAAAREASPARQEALLEALGTVGLGASAQGLFSPEHVAGLLRAMRWAIEQRYFSNEALKRFLEAIPPQATESRRGAEQPLEGAVLREVMRLARGAIEASDEAEANDGAEANEEAEAGAAPRAGGSDAMASDSAERLAEIAPSGEAAIAPSGEATQVPVVRAPSGSTAEAPAAPGRAPALDGEVAKFGGLSPQLSRAERRVTPPHGSPVDVGARGLPPGRDAPPAPRGRMPAARGEAARAAAGAQPVTDVEGLPAGLEYADADEVYVENAGLVVLWPFLGSLFERLELMTEGRFKDKSAQSRAIGLLQHLATGELEPVEYQLALAKVLCGLEAAEVFEFDPPVTEPEVEECAGLLRAAIANAPILGEMSIAGFRGSFLIRKGVLGVRDGAFLLRVERAAYDVVLDRFPWGVNWVKLPWMEAPLGVEW